MRWLERCSRRAAGAAGWGHRTPFSSTTHPARAHSPPLFSFVPLQALQHSALQALEPLHHGLDYKPSSMGSSAHHDLAVFGPALAAAHGVAHGAADAAAPQLHHQASIGGAGVEPGVGVGLGTAPEAVAQLLAGESSFSALSGAGVPPPLLLFGGGWVGIEAIPPLKPSCTSGSLGKPWRSWPRRLSTPLASRTPPPSPPSSPRPTSTARCGGDSGSAS